MQQKRFVWVLLFALCLMACGRSNEAELNQGVIVRNGSSEATAMPAAAPPMVVAESVAEFSKAKSAYRESPPPQAGQESGTLGKVDASQSAAQAFDRKIIRNGNLEIELDQPEVAQRKAATIAETNGGFVVTSEARKTDGSVFVNVVLRVPAANFNTVIELLRSQLGDKAGGKILQDKISGQDVTEEFLDLEARIKTKKALEDQFLVIMRSAHKVEDALEVQRQIAEVRGEIEQMEGRRRFLENQAALSTITMALHTPAPVRLASSPKGFWFQVRQAFANGVDNALGIVLGVIQFVLLMIPILVLIVLPVAAVFWWLKKRLGWRMGKGATSDVSESIG
ncbi:MAG: DUF4349 domain-containing protein [Acidobacteria bacterium]|nr:DUF4349 domain-containing protein [Acidobacteriota bacterium]